MDKNSTNQKQIVIFISGHLDLTEVEFNTHSRPSIDEALNRGDSFVVGDAGGTERTSHGAELNSAPVSSAMAILITETLRERLLGRQNYSRHNSDRHLLRKNQGYTNRIFTLVCDNFHACL